MYILLYKSSCGTVHFIYHELRVKCAWFVTYKNMCLTSYACHIIISPAKASKPDVYYQAQGTVMQYMTSTSSANQNHAPYTQI